MAACQWERVEQGCSREDCVQNSDVVRFINATSAVIGKLGYRQYPDTLWLVVRQ